MSDSKKPIERPSKKRAGRPNSLASLIMSPPRGKRTVSHQRIKAAVEAVFRARTKADA